MPFVVKKKIIINEIIVLIHTAKIILKKEKRGSNFTHYFISHSILCSISDTHVLLIGQSLPSIG